MLDTAPIVAGIVGLRAASLLPFVGVPARRRVDVHRRCRRRSTSGTTSRSRSAYRTGDLSFAYPLMRGTAPLLVTVLGIVFLRELPTAHVIAGIVLISLGHHRHRVRAPRPPSARRRRAGRSPTPRSSPSTRWSTAPARARRAMPIALRHVADLPRGPAVPRVDLRGAAARRRSRYVRTRLAARARSAAPAASPPTASCCGR